MVRTELSEKGYQVIANVLTTEECDGLIRRLSQPDVKRSKAGARHLMSIPEVAKLAGDHRLADVARAALGADPVAFRATLFEKSQQANWLVVWHQDTALPLQQRFDAPGWGPWSIKAGIHYAHAPDWALSRVVALRAHLDESSSENGPLRVLPGSHRFGVLADEAVYRLPDEIPETQCLVGKAGVLVMRPLIVHSSAKSTAAVLRRVLHIEYADSMLRREIGLAVA